MKKATAVASSNIAFVKYWGKRDESLRLPLNSSLSMVLSQATTTTTVDFVPDLSRDEVTIESHAAETVVRARVVAHLDRIRQTAGVETRARVASRSSFPRDAGMASSASGFAALTLAATKAAGLELSLRELSCLARLGSGSAARSISGGFVEWHAGQGHESSWGEQIAPPEHWPELRDIVAIVEEEPKAPGSTEGMALARTSPHLAARLALIGERLSRARQAILERDLGALGQVSEEEAIELHLIAMSSRPPIFYWRPATLALMHQVLAWRSKGLAVYFTMDAGPNVHLLCEEEDAGPLIAALEEMPNVRQIMVNSPGLGAHLRPEHLF